MQKSRAHVAEAPVTATTGPSTQCNKRRPSSRQSTTAAIVSETARQRADQAPCTSPQLQPGQQPPHEMPAPDAAEDVRLTRTGRISKASKGRRVHTCECGKTYTRNEHLSRHQQSHKPDAFPCGIADCKRSFNREDLLDRHKVRQHGVPSSISDAHSSPSIQQPLPTSEGGCQSTMAAPAVQPSFDEPSSEHMLVPAASQPSHAFEQSQFDSRYDKLR
ncbi:hypothetical protein BDY17DRAFT_165535 [Neohortaea acidophila]|uniref:C2H2-type domain-containing protein n=1 Tax=Neohortaea acidophila TaxID=245834 RepID=A0A6A6PU41_9PEZI|nr:uncharacterized protein BDY17DRAFT_165535 [Neohortaea acidophila]KAF2482737.1 hypothetical protein BDY17DRAFT_165535 [Neohortaea acidophila]